MNFAALTAELQDRGHMVDDATRAGVYINDARAILDGLQPWPYLEASAIGTAPLTVTDLRTCEAVSNETLHYPLLAGDWQSLQADFRDLSLTGTPVYFYIASDPPVVATYPTNTDTIGVQYWRVTPDLVAGSDVPAAPARFHPVIVDLAVQRAYLDRDNLDAARGLQPFIDQRLAQMIAELLDGRQLAGPQQHVSVTADASCDG